MSARVRKLIGLVAILAFLVVYVGVATRISDYVPTAGPWRLIYFALAGVLLSLIHI